MAFFHIKSFRIAGRLKASSLHRLIQTTMLIFFLYVAVKFVFFFMYVTGASGFQVAKPAAVEAFLPLSAIIAMKRFLYTGLFDAIHPAGLTILIMAILVSLLLRRAFCGYLCPIGAVSGKLHRLGKRLGISIRLWKWLSIVLSLPKYYILIKILTTFLGMRVDDIEAFLASPYNMVADSKMLLYMFNLGPRQIVMIGLFALGSVMIPSFWCRGFCPYGAFVGLFSMFSPIAIRRDSTRCISCRQCSEACPTRIPVHEKTRISNPECIGCAECSSVCPVDGCLAITFGYTKKSKKLPWWFLAVATVLLFLGIYLIAKLTGHWDSEIPVQMLRMMHERAIR